MHPTKPLVFALLASSLSAQTNLITNGDLELTAPQNYSGSFSFTGWSGSGASGGGNSGLVAGEDAGLAPASGNQHWSFNGVNPGPGSYLETLFNTTPGESYELAYSLGRSGAPGATLQAWVGLYGASNGVIALYLSSPGGGIEYTRFTHQFTATSGSTRLRFTDNSSSNLNSDLYLDAVSVVSVGAIPEPAAAALALGLIAVAVMIRKRAQ